MRVPTDSNNNNHKVRGDSKLLNDGGEIPKSQGKVWQCDS